jgi:hypothetical protein
MSPVFCGWSSYHLSGAQQAPPPISHPQSSRMGRLCALVLDGSWRKPLSSSSRRSPSRNCLAFGIRYTTSAHPFPCVWNAELTRLTTTHQLPKGTNRGPYDGAGLTIRRQHVFPHSDRQGLVKAVLYFANLSPIKVVLRHHLAVGHFLSGVQEDGCLRRLSFAVIRRGAQHAVGAVGAVGGCIRQGRRGGSACRDVFTTVRYKL